MAAPAPVAPHPCPLCDQQAEPALAGLAAVVRDRYRRCAGCGFLFTAADAERERRFYAEVYPYLPHKRAEADARSGIFDRFLDRVAGAAAGRRLLDVGCGQGYFLAAASRRGLDVTGTELSPPYAEEARKRSGAPVVVGGLDALVGAEPFDWVTMWNVLDQTADAPGLARASWRLLRPGGRLFVRVPNGSFHRPLMSLAARLGPRGARALAALTPCHPWVFRPADLRRLLARSGFAEVRVAGTALTRGFPSRAAAPSRLVVSVLKLAVERPALLLERAASGRMVLSPSLEAVARR